MCSYLATFWHHLYMEYISLSVNSRSYGSYHEFLERGFIVLKLKPSFWKFYAVYHDLVTNNNGYISFFRNHSPFPHSWLIIGFATRVTRRVSLVEQELLSLLEHLRFFVGVRWSDLIVHATPIVISSPIEIRQQKAKCNIYIWEMSLSSWYTEIQ